MADTSLFGGCCQSVTKAAGQVFITRSTDSTENPASRMSFAVPPEASSRTSFLISPFARSSKPVLLKTERIASRQHTM